MITCMLHAVSPYTSWPVISELHPGCQRLSVLDTCLSIRTSQTCKQKEATDLDHHGVRSNVVLCEIFRSYQGALIACELRLCSSSVKLSTTTVYLAHPQNSRRTPPVVSMNK